MITFQQLNESYDIENSDSLAQYAALLEQSALWVNSQALKNVSLAIARTFVFVVNEIYADDTPKKSYSSIGVPKPYESLWQELTTKGFCKLTLVHETNVITIERLE